MSLAKARELRQERAKVIAEAKELYTDNPTVEQRAEWEKRMDRADELEKQYVQLEADNERQRAAEESLAEQQRALDDTREFGAKRVSAEDQETRHVDAFRTYLITGDDSELRALGTQKKGTTTLGGYTVPTLMQNDIVSAMLLYGGMRQAARSIRTATGANLQWPVSDDTGNKARIYTEATASSTTTAVTFGQKTLEAVKYGSGPIKISSELVQDSIADIEGFVREAMSHRFGRALNYDFTLRSSTESVGPHGIINDSTGALTVAVSAGLTSDNLISLEHSVDPYYRNGAVWMFNDATKAVIRKLRVGSSREYVWQPGLQNGEPDRLLGYPVIINQDMQSVTTAAKKPIFFGNFNHYIIRDVLPMAIRRLDERYADEDVVALIGFHRADGRSVFGSTVPARKPYRCILTTT